MYQFSPSYIFAFWKGSIPALTGALSENAVAFGVNGALKRYVFRNREYMQGNKFMHSIHPFLTSGITGAFTAVVLHPLFSKDISIFIK
jgi:hypothetical protein